jgi:hypothetical protein
LIFCYTLARALLLSVTWDESQSYREFIQNGVIVPEVYDMMAANNHTLNTAGSIFFIKLFGTSEFTLRITVLIAHLFFLLFSARLVLKLNSRWLIVSAFLVINLNPFLLDFFSISRGYGIANGMMMASIYYLYCFQNEGLRTKDAVLVILFAGLASLGNLTLLNYCVVVYGLIFLLLVSRHFRENKAKAIAGIIRQMLFPTFLLALLFWFIIPISFDLRAAGALFLGGSSGLWTDTLGTIVPRLWYNLDLSYWLIRLTKAFFFVVMFSAGALVLMKYLRKQLPERGRFLALLLLLFVLIILSTVVQHYLLGTLFLIERGVLFLFILFTLILVFFIDQLSSEKKKLGALMHLSAAAVLIHFLCSFNLKYVYEWKDDCETKEMLSDLERIREKPRERFNISLGMPLSLESSINFYRIVRHYDWLSQAMRSKRVNYLNDYFLLTPREQEYADRDSLEILKTYPITGNILAKPRYPFKKAQIVLDSTIRLSGGDFFRLDSAMEYSPGFKITISDTLPVRNSVISFRLLFRADRELLGNVQLIAAYADSTGLYSWIPVKLNDFYKTAGEEAELCYTAVIPDQAKKGDILSLYIWNPFHQEVYLKEMQLRWIRHEY